jgi:hypothetical protein
MMPFSKKFWIAVVVTVLIGLAFSFLARAQETPKSWLIWEKQFPGSSWPQAQVYKIQDGNCSIYVALGYPGNSAPIAIATGQGCK